MPHKVVTLSLSKADTDRLDKLVDPELVKWQTRPAAIRTILRRYLDEQDQADT